MVRGAGKERSLGSDGVCLKGDARHSFANLEKARHILGYSPRVPLETGLKEFVGWSRVKLLTTTSDVDRVNSDIPISLVYQLLIPCSRGT